MSEETLLLDSPAMGKKQSKSAKSPPPDAASAHPTPEPKPRKGKAGNAATAESMAEKQREISVSEFFAKNRHLLGFDNPRKALLTAVKEAVDNALDACEEAGILPDILVDLRAVPEAMGGGEDRFIVIVQDNGPGIVRKQIENIFGKLLYGSKFHRLKMSRGQQGIGISAAGMYGLITTGKPVRIISKTAPKKPAHEVVLKMDTSKNRADVVSETEHPEDDALFPDGRGTRVEIELVGKYATGDRSVDQYIQLSAIANPHARFTFISPPTSAMPNGEKVVFDRGVNELPEATEEIKPHPHGIELGTLIGMLERTEESQLGGFFANEFCRITPKVGQDVAQSAGLTTRSWVKNIGHAEAEKLYKALQDARVMAPPTNCLSPIGVRTMIKGLEQGLAPDFIAVSSRPPAVYRGRPFIIEAGVAFGGNLPAEDAAKVFRFANRVPLQYQQSACASFKAVGETNWKAYGLQQPRGGGGMPVGPLVVMIHMASVWVPFTSESKEAIADYDEIRKEMKLALMDCGRKLGSYLRKRAKMRRAGERRDIFRRYIGEVAKACEALTGGSVEAEKVYEALLATARTKTIETDQILDEEGKVVAINGEGGGGDGDNTVYIREPASDDDNPPATQALTDADGPAPAKQKRGNRAPTSDNSLFGDESDAEPSAAAAKKSTKKKKKVAKKVVRKKGG